MNHDIDLNSFRLNDLARSIGSGFRKIKPAGNFLGDASQVLSFLDEIENAALSQMDLDLGELIFSVEDESESEIEIRDGTQRITSLIIILAVLFRLMRTGRFTPAAVARESLQAFFDTARGRNFIRSLDLPGRADDILRILVLEDMASADGSGSDRPDFRKAGAILEKDSDLGLLRIFSLAHDWMDLRRDKAGKILDTLLYRLFLSVSRKDPVLLQ